MCKKKRRKNFIAMIFSSRMSYVIRTSGKSGQLKGEGFNKFFSERLPMSPGVMGSCAVRRNLDRRR